MQTSVLPGLKVGAQAGYPVRDSLSFAASVLLPGRLYPHPQCLNLSSQAECVNCARLHSHDSTSELYYSCIKGKYQTKLFSQITNAAEVI
ncbi:hypothetical protein EB796_005940 [Bugula neritina]|uniref:Uncharacterized protein n=1 Tax=Bugula neritina TaxID=10212 RepID=A0A7J7KDQ2_BUGNE|nr:hypothetical protein EB796_005940 [Bugula neritina]